MTVTYPPRVRDLTARHRRVSLRVRLVRGVDVFELPSADVALDADNGRMVRRTAGISAPFTEETWARVREWASPQVWIDAGYTYPNGTVDSARVFTGRLIDVASRRPDDTLRMTAQDTSSQWEDLPVTADQPAVGGSVLQTMNALTSGTGLTFTNQSVADAALPAGYLIRAGADRHGALDELADTVAGCLCADPDGSIRLHPQPTLTGSTAATLEVGPQGSIRASSSEYLRHAFANRLRIISRWRDAAGNETSAVGVATDTDPNSPTRWDGPAGRREIIETLDQPTDTATLTAQAKTRLARWTGLGRGVSITTPLALWIDLHDRVWIRLPWGDALDHVVIRISHDFAAGQTVLDTSRPLSKAIT